MTSGQPYTTGIRDGSMTGYEGVDVQGQRPVQFGDPARRRTGAHDRSGADEQQVSGEHDPTVRVVHGDIPVGMRRPGSEQSDRAVTDPQLDVRRDGVVGQPRVDPGEVKSPERPMEIATQFWFQVRCQHARNQGRGLGTHVHGGFWGRQDLSVGGEKFVAVTAIAVAVSVDGVPDGRCRDDRPHFEELVAVE